MNNYEYIIAGLPVIRPDYRGELDCDSVIAEIREQLSAKDNALMQTLLDGFEGENLNAGFYESALKSGNRFIREYFRYDLGVRNSKVAYLNRELGRPEGMDILVPEAYADEEFEGQAEACAVFEKTDLLERERALDSLMWEKIDELTVMDVFTLDLVLAFAAKMQIVSRWLKLDPGTGRELFRQLVDEIRNNKKELA
ncbi:MAG: DUF2764 domain-containing protein [Bacteroidales bacterium]|nr:DUF2764 domain-containing protein [Bacteroidales bacterium]